jgi:hypothetical protein
MNKFYFEVLFFFKKNVANYLIDGLVVNSNKVYIFSLGNITT